MMEADTLLGSPELSSSSQQQASAPAAEPDSVADAAAMLRQRLQPDELAPAASKAGSWLWYGYLGAGKITLLTSQWKSGKTTLISVLAARMGQGGELAGLPVAAGRAAIISEEGPDNWDGRCRKLGIGNHLSLFCRPFRTKPTMAQWCGMIHAMLELQRREGLDLVVIDPLAVFLPGSNENAAGVMLECLLPLRELTARGLSVLLVHHPRKGFSRAGQAARGSGALASHVDILMEMNWYGKPDEDDRRRWMRAYSRHEETRRHLVLELVAAGNDYRAHDLVHDEFGESWQVLNLVLEEASERLTQQQILDQWPEDFRKPERSTIRRGLGRGLEQGLIRKQGTGRRNDPYRYWLPSKEADFCPGPGASAEEIEHWRQHGQAKRLPLLSGIASRTGAETTAAAGIPEERAPQTAAKPPGVVAGQAALEPALTDSRTNPAETRVLEPEAPAAVWPEPARPAAPAMPITPSAPTALALSAAGSASPPLSAAPAAAVPASAPQRPAPPAEESIEEKRRRIRRWPVR